MPSFVRVIRDAYDDVLAREPDPSGLAVYNRSMNQGLSEASLREMLLRSREFALRFPDAQLGTRLALNAHVPEGVILEDIRGKSIRFFICGDGDGGGGRGSDIARSGQPANLTKVEAMEEIAVYGILRTPGLVIDEKVVASGRIPGAAEIVTIIATAAAKA